MSMIFNGTALDLIIDIANAKLCQSNSFLVDRGKFYVQIQVPNFIPHSFYFMVTFLRRWLNLPI